MSDRKQINFTIVPEDDGTEPRTYANFCARQPHAVRLHAHLLRSACRCPKRKFATPRPTTSCARRFARALVLPVQFVPTLIAALQENLRIFSESHQPQPQPPQPPDKGPGALSRTVAHCESRTR